MPTLAVGIPACIIGTLLLPLLYSAIFRKENKRKGGFTEHLCTGLAA
jgi:hypothetical protein